MYICTYMLCKYVCASSVEKKNKQEAQKVSFLVNKPININKQTFGRKKKNKKTDRQAEQRNRNNTSKYNRKSI